MTVSCDQEAAPADAGRPLRVLVAMSGGVDSSVAAALAVAAGHEVVGATLKLWGGESDSGCCSVADVDDARRVAQQLGIAHHVFNMAEEFDRSVVAPYVAEHAAGRTPNPCIECNRHLKFGRLLERSRRLGFDVLATGHHARVVAGPGGPELRRGADRLKDQSYVVSMLTSADLGHVAFPVGSLTKAQVRVEAARLGLRTADKPDSQDVCFIAGPDGRRRFLAQRIELHPARVVDADTGDEVGSVEAVELVTVGQRKGLVTGGRRRYAVAVDVPGRRVTVADRERADQRSIALEPRSLTWVDGAPPPGAALLVQVSAHGRPLAGGLESGADGAALCVFARPERPVAAGQTVAFYAAEDPERVLGAAICAGPGPLDGDVPR
jgi:tRNA-specific 2-thiouridylase